MIAPAIYKSYAADKQPHKNKSIVTCAIEEEQCFKRHLQSAAQCSVASSNNKFGYLHLWVNIRYCMTVNDDGPETVTYLH